MADFSWVDKLDAEQQANLAKVIDAAEKVGINPRLAAAVAYTESQLRHRTTGDKPSVIKGNAGEIGIMQIKPSTAKLMGYDTSKIMDTDANIEAGLRYLKQQLDRFNDPELAAMAYNTGPDTEFFKTLGKVNPSPDGVRYVERVGGFGGFVVPESAAEASPYDTNPIVEPMVTQPSEQDFRTWQAAGMGALAGAGAGMVPPFRGMIQGNQRPTAADRIFAGQTPGEKWAQKVTGYVRPGADSVTEAAQAYQRAKPSGIITGRLAQRYGPPPPSQPGVFTGGRLAGMTPPTPPAPLSQQLGEGMQAVSRAMGRTPVITGALAGAGMAGGAEEARQRSEAGDIVGRNIAGTGALGSGLTLLPSSRARILGAGLSIASPAALAVLDKMREIGNQPPPPPATAAEIERAQKPAFIYPNP